MRTVSKTLVETVEQVLSFHEAVYKEKKNLQPDFSGWKTSLNLLNSQDQNSCRHHNHEKDSILINGNQSCCSIHK